MYLLLARIYEFRWQLTASPGFPAQVCNSQGGRRHCFIMLGCLLPILCGFYFLYIGRDSFTHLRITRHSSIILINHVWLKNRVFSIFLSACKQGFCLRRSRGHFPSLKSFWKILHKWSPPMTSLPQPAWCDELCLARIWYKFVARHDGARRTGVRSWPTSRSLLTVYRLSTLEAGFLEEKKFSRFACDEKALRRLSRPENELKGCNFWFLCVYTWG